MSFSIFDSRIWKESFDKKDDETTYTNQNPSEVIQEILNKLDTEEE